VAKVPSKPEDGSKRVLVFDTKLDKVGSGRGVSGLVGIHYGVLDPDLESHIRNGLQPGRYKLVVQKKSNLRWVHVSSSEVLINALAPS